MLKKFVIMAIACSLIHAGQLRAELVIGVTSARNLISFDTATPGTIISSTAITGLQDAFEAVNSIDFRPGTGIIYALGNAPGSIYRLYTLNATTGVATKVGADITGLITGSFQGLDFNPVVDLLRITTDSDQNFRFNPNTGAMVAQDANLAYAAGDSGAGQNPNIVGSAYINNVPSSAATTLFNIDSNRDVLTTQIPPNNGTLNTVGALGVDFQNFTGFDVSGATGTAFASTTNPGAPTLSNLYTINLATGAASLVGQIGSNLVLNDIAIVSAVPEPSSLALLSIGSVAWLKFRRRRTNNA